MKHIVYRVALMLFAVGCGGRGTTSILIHISAADGLTLTTLSLTAVVVTSGATSTQSLPANADPPHLPGRALVVLPDIASDVSLTLSALSADGRALRTPLVTKSVPFTQIEVSMELGVLPPGDGWYDMPDTQITAICPPATASYDFNTMCGHVLDAQNGAIADTKRNRLIAWGGGFGEYMGNELYGLDLGDLTLSRLTDPSPLGATCAETLADGRPTARSTSDGMAYVAHLDQLFVVGGSLDCGNDPTSSATWLFDLASLSWRQSNATGPQGFERMNADYDPVSKQVFVHDTSSLFSFDADTDVYTKIVDGQVDYHLTGRFDQKRRLFVMVGCSACMGGGMQVFDIGSGNPAVQDWTAQVSGCDELLAANSPGFVYRPDLGVFIGWPGSGNTVYSFDPDTKVCTPMSFPNGPVVDVTSISGIFGRFRYFPSLDVFAVLGASTVDAFSLRLP